MYIYVISFTYNSHHHINVHRCPSNRHDRRAHPGAHPRRKSHTTEIAQIQKHANRQHIVYLLFTDAKTRRGVAHRQWSDTWRATTRKHRGLNATGTSLWGPTLVQQKPFVWGRGALTCRVNLLTCVDVSEWLCYRTHNNRPHPSASPVRDPPLTHPDPLRRQLCVSSLDVWYILIVSHCLRRPYKY